METKLGWVLTLLVGALLLLLPVVVQAQFNFTTNVDGTLNISKYTGSGGALVIPDMTNGLPVTSIGTNACQSAALTSVAFGTNVTSIRSSAFFFCTNLTSLTFGPNIGSIGASAFASCINLPSVNIPGNLTNIASFAFSSCKSLIAITVDASNPTYSSLAGVLFDKNQTKLIQCPPRIAGSYMLPNGVTSIADRAFNYCANLTNVLISIGVTNIGSDVFDFCTSLTAISADINSLAYSSMSGVLFNKTQTSLIAFPPGTAGNYTIPDSVTNIGTGAFNYCIGLSGVVVPNGVINIGTNAFEECYNMTNVVIGNGVTSIGQNGFYGCFNLTSITLPSGITSIGPIAFGNTGLTNFTIPSSINNIANSLFFACYNLTNITIPYGITNIGMGAFQACNLTSVVIPGSVISIGQAAFLGCFALTNVVISNGVVSIGFGAFQGCRLTSVTIPGSVASIGQAAFLGCYALSNAIIADGVVSIGNSAFADCGLTTLTIPESVTSIGNSAFSICPNLKSVYFAGNAPGIVGSPSIFSGDNNPTVYYLPATSGWGAVFGGAPTVLWNPQAQTGDSSFGVLNNMFGFNITGSSNLIIVVEANTNLARATWFTVGTNTLNTFIGTNGLSYFSDPHWTNFPGRFYRFRSP